MLYETKCAICGKIFYPTELHVYKDHHGLYCSWTCYRKRDQIKGPAKIRMRQRYKKIDQYTLDGEYVDTHVNAEYAAYAVDGVVGSLRAAITNERPYKGYVWKYSDVSEEN